MLAIDQYAETTSGNRDNFLNQPHSTGGMKDNIPWQQGEEGIGSIDESHSVGAWDARVGEKLP